MKSREIFAQIPASAKSISEMICSIIRDNGLNIEELGLRMVSNSDELRDIWSVPDFFKDLKVLSLIDTEMEVLIQRRDETVFWYMGNWLVADDLHPILFAAVKRALAKDPNCIKPCTRRFIVAAFTDGLSVSHFSKIDECANSMIQDRVTLDFDRSSDITREVLFKDFDFAIESFCRNLCPNLPEANLISCFWGVAASQYFLKNGGKEIMWQQEWNIQNLDPNFLNRRVDFVELLEISGKVFPVLLVEAGVDEAATADQHKDFTKLSCIISSCSFRMMKHLADNGCDPNEARCYGLLIGGTKAHCLIAHPVLHDKDRYVQITSDPEWSIKVLCGASSESILTPSSTNAFQIVSQDSTTISDGRLIKLDIPAPIEKVECNANKSKFLAEIAPISDKTSTDQIVDALVEEDLNNSNDKKRLLSDSDISFKRSKSQEVTRDWFITGPSLSGLQRLHLFFDAILERKKFLETSEKDWEPSEDEPGVRNITPDIKPKALTANFTKEKEKIKRGSSIDSNIKNMRLLDLGSKPDSSMAENEAGRIFIKKYYANSEIMFYNLTNLCGSRFFARNYSIKCDEATSESLFEFEHMVPMIDIISTGQYIWSSDMFAKLASPHQSMVQGIKFALDTLVGLNFLHNYARILHNNISPANIMYSHIDCCWKLIDFKAVSAVESALKTEIDHGTHGFKAPEVETYASHSTASDVFALGSVFMKVLLKTLPGRYQIEPDARVIDDFYQLFLDMTDPDPHKRPSVICATKIALKAFKCFAPNYQDFIIRAAENMISNIDIDNDILSNNDSHAHEVDAGKTDFDLENIRPRTENIPVYDKEAFCFLCRN